MAQNRMQERIRSSALGTAIMSLVAFYLGDRIGAYIVFGLDMQLGSQVTRGLQALIAKPLYLDLNMMPLLYGFILCAIVWLVWLRYVVFVGNYRTGEESGSAQWGSEKQGLAFRDQTNSSNNLLFTRKYGLALKQPKFNEETYRNLNVCVIGGSGSGKTKRYVKPNLMQLNANYFVTDPKGTLPEETGYLFIDNGYKLKSFNTVDFSKSQHYNPLAYVKTDAEILSFVNCFIMNTNDPTKTGGESFWEDSEGLSQYLLRLKPCICKTPFADTGLLPCRPAFIAMKKAPAFASASTDAVNHRNVLYMRRSQVPRLLPGTQVGSRHQSSSTRSRLDSPSTVLAFRCHRSRFHAQYPLPKH